MARARLLFGLLTLCILVSACEKAKMRTVPAQDPNASASADPGLPPPSSADPQDDYVPDSEPQPSEPVVSHTPPPPPSRPVARLDDEDSEVIEEEPVDGPLRRPEPRPRPRPRPAPRRELPCCDDQIVQDCEPRPRTEVIVRERPRPRPRPVVREEVIIEEGGRIELGEIDLHCRWEPTARPITYLRFDPIRKIAWVKFGWPQKWSQYTGVRVVSGLPPYFDRGVTLVTRAGVPIASLKGTGNGRIWYENNTKYPYEATFGEVPGGPRNRNVRGVCWSKEEPAKTENNR